MKIYPTCSICKHFDSNKEYCTLLEEMTTGTNQEKPSQCVKEGAYLRDINVLLDSYHLYKADEEIPYDFVIDKSKLPADKNGKPLFVLTKRGMERAIPAYDGVELISDFLLGVNKVLTFQGQRELIYDLGVDLAKKVAATRNVELLILPGEENSTGIPSEVKRHMVYQSVGKRRMPVGENYDEYE